MEEEKKAEEVKIVESKPSEAKPESVSSESKPEMKTESSSGMIKKRNNKTWIFFGIVVVLIIAIILVLVLLNPKTGTATKEMLTVQYAVYSGGSLVDSGNTTVEKGKLSSALGLGSNKLDEEISSMSAGQEKNITLSEGDAYGAYDPTLKFTIDRVEKQNRTNEMNRTTWVDISTFTQAFSEQPQLNKNYNLSGAPWLYKVVDLNSTSVKLSQEANLNQEIPVGTFFYRVMAITADKITLKMFGEDSVIPTDNGDYDIKFTDTEVLTTFNPELGAVVSLTGYPQAKVVEMNATTITLDANGPDAGKPVTVTINLIATKKETISGNVIKNIEGAPTLQFFIMSHCPYGTQMAKGVIPVWEAFKDKANIEMRFVSYTMHGAQEDLDNNRLICIREEQSAKLIAYLKCFVYGEGSEVASQSCLTSTGIDTAKLDSCLASKVTGYMDVDKALNTQYGVQGSPTVIIDGKEVSVYPRDPASVAKALCDAFTTKPSECSQTFDSTNPSPGFGGGSASSSGSAASCG